MHIKIFTNHVFCNLRFGHVQRSPLETPVHRVDQMDDSPISRGRGRPKKIIGETIRKHLIINNITIEMCK